MIHLLLPTTSQIGWFVGVLFFVFSPVMAAKEFAVPNKLEEMRAVEVAKNVYVLHGMSGFPTSENAGRIANTGFVVTQDGVVMIDTGGSTAHGEFLLDAIQQVTPKPVVAVFNTHIHGDHWLGNAAIAARYPQARFYAHENVMADAANGEGERWVALMQRLTDGATDGTIVSAATHAVTSGDTIVSGDERFIVLHTGSAHTTGDIMIHVVSSNVVFLGDNAFYQRIGRMDDGNFAGNIKALDTSLDLDAAIYVPGHGSATTGVLAAKSYRDYLSTLFIGVTELFDEGLADFEMKERLVASLAPWRNWLGFEDEIGRHISFLFLQIEEASF